MEINREMGMENSEIKEAERTIHRLASELNKTVHRYASEGLRVEMVMGCSSIIGGVPIPQIHPICTIAIRDLS